MRLANLNEKVRNGLITRMMLRAKNTLRESQNLPEGILPNLPINIREDELLNLLDIELKKPEIMRLGYTERVRARIESAMRSAGCETSNALNGVFTDFEQVLKEHERLQYIQPCSTR